MVQVGGDYTANWGEPIAGGLVTWRYFIPAIIGVSVLLWHFFFYIIPSVQSVDIDKISDVYKPDIYNIWGIIIMAICAGIMILVVYYVSKHTDSRDDTK